MSEAKACVESGNYSAAVNYATQAMEAFRDTFKGIMRILEQAGVEKGELLRAQGLIVAATRALERIERIEKILPENATDVRQLLDQAKSLLNMTEITQMLQQGKISEAAQRLAEANRLINEAFKALKAKAEEKMSERMKRFCEKLEEKFEGLIESMRGKGLNVADFLKEHNMTAFQESLNQFRMNLQKGKGDWKGRLPQLKEFQQRFKTSRRRRR
ncbi:MAG: hypothetical protein QXK47_05600 [Candidatus Bathyarchaeia archaeon]